AELTPPHSAEERRRRLLSAHFHRLAGGVERSAAILEELRRHVPGGAERADVLFELALTRTGSTQAMGEMCAEALAEVPADDVRSARILSYRSWVNLAGLDISGSLADGRQALQKAEEVGDPELVAVAISRLGTAETYADEVTPGLLQRGADMEREHGLELEYLASPGIALARRAMRVDEIDEARALYEEQAAKAADRGDEGTRGQVLGALSGRGGRAGRWSPALDQATAPYDMARHSQDPHVIPNAGRMKGLIEVDLGNVDQARRTVEESLTISASVK